MSHDKVLKMCKVLNLDPTSFIDIDVLEKEKKLAQFSIEEKQLLSNFNKLNSTGKSEANKRVEELTFVNRYTTQEENNELTEKKFSWEDLKKLQEAFNNRDRAVIAAFGEGIQEIELPKEPIDLDDFK